MKKIVIAPSVSPGSQPRLMPCSRSRTRYARLDLRLSGMAFAGLGATAKALKMVRRLHATHFQLD